MFVLVYGGWPLQCCGCAVVPGRAAGRAGPTSGCTAGAVCTNCHPGICTRRDYVPFVETL